VVSTPMVVQKGVRTCQPEMRSDSCIGVPLAESRASLPRDPAGCDRPIHGYASSRAYNSAKRPLLTTRQRCTIAKQCIEIRCMAGGGERGGGAANFRNTVAAGCCCPVECPHDEELPPGSADIA